MIYWETLTSESITIVSPFYAQWMILGQDIFTMDDFVQYTEKRRFRLHRMMSLHFIPHQTSNPVHFGQHPTIFQWIEFSIFIFQPQIRSLLGIQCLDYFIQSITTITTISQISSLKPIKCLMDYLTSKSDIYITTQLLFKLRIIFDSIFSVIHSHPHFLMMDHHCSGPEVAICLGLRQSIHRFQVIHLLNVNVTFCILIHRRLVTLLPR